MEYHTTQAIGSMEMDGSCYFRGTVKVLKLKRNVTAGASAYESVQVTSVRVQVKDAEQLHLETNAKRWKHKSARSVQCTTSYTLESKGRRYKVQLHVQVNNKTEGRLSTNPGGH